MNDRIDTILHFWFGDPDAAEGALARRWFQKDPAFDDEIRRTFGDDIEEAARGERSAWAESARGALALVVLLDQLPRNVFRGSPRSFAGDARAFAVSEDAQARGLDRALSFLERYILLMPMMHAEDRAAQRRSVEAFARLAADAQEAAAPESVQKMLRGAHDYATRHAQIVERFGRFPHRNGLLERAASPEEVEFLKEPGSSF
jgi:uncharacterized protein (DUF924 family)